MKNKKSKKSDIKINKKGEAVIDGSKLSTASMIFLFGKSIENKT